MTRDEIMALSGRELDAAIAERVCGWMWIRTMHNPPGAFARAAAKTKEG